MQKLLPKFLIIGGVLLANFLFSSPVYACSCYTRETVDKELAKRSNVAILKLQSIKQNDNEPRNFFFSVEKVFKGELKLNEVLTFRLTSGCSMYFSEEQVDSEFLFYLGNRPAKDEFWSASTCSRSGPVKNTTNDLRYLENEKKLRGKTRLSGSIAKWVETLNDSSFIPLADRKIRIVGKSKTAEVTTDETGAYEIYDLPPGKYKIYPGKLDGFSFQKEKSDFEEIEIKAKSQTEQNFFYSMDNTISGKVVDREGNPLKEICVDLYSLKMEKVLGFSHKSCTDEDGEFEISAIPVGTYKIVVNGEDIFNRFSRSPFFETFYYPNVETLEKAAEFLVGENFFLKNLILVPPEVKETITLTGRVIYADGKPAADKTVQFVSSEKISEIDNGIVISDFEVKTNRNGQFTIKTLKGQAGILRASFFTYREENKNCPEIEETLKRKSVTIHQLETSRLEITGTENLTGIELKFSFPYCKEAK